MLSVYKADFISGKVSISSDVFPKVPSSLGIVLVFSELSEVNSDHHVNSQESQLRDSILGDYVVCHLENRGLESNLDFIWKPRL